MSRYSITTLLWRRARRPYEPLTVSSPFHHILPTADKGEWYEIFNHQDFEDYLHHPRPEALIRQMSPFTISLDLSSASWLFTNWLNGSESHSLYSLDAIYVHPDSVGPPCDSSVRRYSLTTADVNFYPCLRSLSIYKESPATSPVSNQTGLPVSFWLPSLDDRKWRHFTDIKWLSKPLSLKEDEWDASYEHEHLSSAQSPPQCELILSKMIMNYSTITVEIHARFKTCGSSADHQHSSPRSMELADAKHSITAPELASTILDAQAQSVMALENVGLPNQAQPLI